MHRKKILDKKRFIPSKYREKLSNKQKIIIYETIKLAKYNNTEK